MAQSMSRFDALFTSMRVLDCVKLWFPKTPLEISTGQFILINSPLSLYPTSFSQKLDSLAESFYLFFPRLYVFY